MRRSWLAVRSRSCRSLLAVPLVALVGACTGDNPSYTATLPDGGFSPFGDLASLPRRDGSSAVSDFAVAPVVDLAKPPPPDLADTSHGPGEDVAEDPAQWDVADANGDT